MQKTEQKTPLSVIETGLPSNVQFTLPEETAPEAKRPFSKKALETFSFPQLPKLSFLVAVLG
jgi:hypothetical protein